MLPLAVTRAQYGTAVTRAGGTDDTRRTVSQRVLPAERLRSLSNIVRYSLAPPLR
jgi:hypothetical protein